MPGHDPREHPGDAHLRAVEARIRAGDPWYVGSQFEWAEKPAIRPIYAKRFAYFRACGERARTRLGRRLRLLDAGCGDGYWLMRLAGVPDVELTGIDYNPLRVERARRVAPHATVTCSDLMSYEPEEPFDLVLLNQVIEHVADDVALLARVRALLRPGGVLILGTPNEGSLLQRWRVPAGTDHVHLYTEDEVRRTLARAGFEIESVMREIFYVGSDTVYYGLARRRWGFALLELLTRLLPSQCSDYYFECRMAGEPEA